MDMDGNECVWSAFPSPSAELLGRSKSAHCVPICHSLVRVAVLQRVDLRFGIEKKSEIVRLCVGMCWCVLVCVGMCWCVLVCVGVCWCVLV